MSTPKLPAVTTRHRAALEPQRKPGKQRVAELLRAGAGVIAERGFEAATMSEIASRAGAPIGSLYRFFPSKEVLADALIRRYSELVDSAFEKINSSREALTTEAFADSLLDALTELRGETQACVVVLLNARADASAHRAEFHEALLRHITRTLKQREPELNDKEAEDMAVVLLQNMKAMKSLDPQQDAGAIAELRTMTRLYLEGKLG
jgi:AcrR family transcriptional regulator